MKLGDILVQKYSTIDRPTIFSIRHAQIENKLESVKHVKVRFSLVDVRANPTRGFSANRDGVCLNSVGCSRYFVGLVRIV